MLKKILGETMKKLIISVVALGSFVFAADNCAMCHNGGMAKKLDTLTPAQIEAKMKEFKAGKGNSMMVGQAQSLSDDEVKTLAEKYGKK